MISQTAAHQQSPALAYARVQDITSPKTTDKTSVQEKNYTLRLGRLKLEYSREEARPESGSAKIPPPDFTEHLEGAWEKESCLYSLHRQQKEKGVGVMPRAAACRAYSHQQNALEANAQMINHSV